MAQPGPPRRCRSVFLSDVHLGARACRAEALLGFLDGLSCERLYLIGDIVDGWRLQRRWFWPRAHAAVLDGLLGLAREGVEVIYVPGNHDAFARSFCGSSAAGVRIETETVHLAADGRRYLIAHGDAYDPKADQGAVSAFVGDAAYRGLMRLDRAWRWTCRRAGGRETSLAAGLKARSATARRVVEAFEAALAAEAGRRGLDGVVCGHIHSASAREIDGLAYLNCGDWVESLSAVVEGFDGRLDVVRWEPQARRAPRARPAIRPEPAWSA
jgi:UDP-2,3-diacylglucosamine pyrophosphatase LpxH